MFSKGLYRDNCNKKTDSKPDNQIQLEYRQ